MNPRLTSPVGRVGELLAALDRLHGVSEGGAGFSAVQQCRVKSVDKHLGGGDRHGPERDQHTLSPRGEEGPGETHHTVGCHLAVRLRVGPEQPSKHTHYKQTSESCN